MPYKVEGIGQDKIPGTLDMCVIDDFMTVSDKDVVRHGAAAHARGRIVRRRLERV